MELVQHNEQIQTKELLQITFSCVAYLRDLFGDSCFEDQKLGEMALKRLKRSQDPSVNLFLDWLEKGVFDAIDKKYLKSIIIGIYLNESDPEKVAETYTFEFDYFKDETQLIESALKVVRTLCVLTQTLKPLPCVKYVTVKLYYLENVPVDYEPPGFKSASDHKFEFTSEPLKLDVGKVVSEGGGATLKIHTLFDNNSPKTTKESSPKESIHETQNNSLIQDSLNTEKKSMVDSQNYTLSNNNTNLPIENTKKGVIDSQNYTLSNNNDNLPIENTKIGVVDSQNYTLSNNNTNLPIENIKKNKSSDSIRCLCGINVNDVEMLYCDKCTNWLHTVCCGFFSNTDKRIPKNEYVCNICKEGMGKCIAYYKRLAIIRRTLSVIYNEGINNPAWLSSRMGISIPYTRSVLKRLESEGFIKRERRGVLYIYEVLKSKENKNKLKEYFSLNLRNFDVKTSIPLKDIKCIKNG